MTLGIRCLLTDDPARGARTGAGPGAAQPGPAANSRRRCSRRRWRRSTRASRRCEGRVPAGVCVFDAGWHQGVIGLVASRVKERLHRPVIAFAPADPGWVKGSARSVPGVHVRDVLDAVATRRPGLARQVRRPRHGGRDDPARERRARSSRRRSRQEVGRGGSTTTRWPATCTRTATAAGRVQRRHRRRPCARAARGVRAFRSRRSTGEFGVIDTRIVGDRHLKLRLRAPSGEVVDAIAFRYSTRCAGDPAHPSWRQHDRRRGHGYTPTAARDGVGRDARAAQPAGTSSRSGSPWTGVTVALAAAMAAPRGSTENARIRGSRHHYS